MPRAYSQTNFWTPQRDARLRELWAEEPRKRISDIAAEFQISDSYVSEHAHALNLPRRIKERFFTPERDAKLRELWTREPRVSMSAIRRALGDQVTTSAISQRAIHFLKLPSRQARSSKPPQLPKADAPPAAPKPAPLLATPCPYLDPHGAPDPVTGRLERCGVWVDRRVRKDGTKPNPYCAEHAPRVTPISKGPLGAVGGRSGVRYAAGITGWRS